MGAAEKPFDLNFEGRIFGSLLASCPVTTQLQPLWTMTLDQIENSGPPGPQHRQILGQKQQAERKHPDAADRQKRKDTSEDQQQACGMRTSGRTAGARSAQAQQGKTRSSSDAVILHVRPLREVLIFSFRFHLA